MFGKYKHQSSVIFPFKIRISGEYISTWDQFYVSNFWKAYKLLARTRLPYKCWKCGKRKSLQLHHKSYKDIGEFNFRRVTWSCAKHH